MNFNFAKVPWYFPLRLSVKELAAFMLLPYGEDEFPDTNDLHPKLTLPPKWYQEPTNDIHGRTFVRGRVNIGSQKLSISRQDMENLEAALDLIEDCGQTYRAAPVHTKRFLNQAIFKRFVIYNQDEVRVEPEPAEPFDQILEPIKDNLAIANKVKHSHSESLSEIIRNANRHIHEFFGCGDLHNAIESYSDNSKFFELKSSSKDFLFCVDKKDAAGKVMPEPNCSPAQYPQGVGRIRKAAEPPTAALRLQFGEEEQGSGADDAF